MILKETSVQNACNVGFKLACDVHVCAYFEKLLVLGKTYCLQKWPIVLFRYVVQPLSSELENSKYYQQFVTKMEIPIMSDEFHYVYGKISCVP